MVLRCHSVTKLFDTCSFNSCACRRMMCKIVRNVRLNSTFTQKDKTGLELLSADLS